MSSCRIPPLSGGIHLSNLSDFPGPPHIPRAKSPKSSDLPSPVGFLVDRSVHGRSSPKPDKNWNATRRTHVAAKRNAREALKEVCRDFGARLHSNEIVAFGSAKDSSAHVRIPTELWTVLRPRSRRAWYESRFSGGGHAYHEVRFHRADALETWRKGAPLAFAIRAIAPLEWANYHAFWSPEHAPENWPAEDQRQWGAGDREEFWNMLLSALSGNCLELRLLWPPGDPRATWTPVSQAVQELLHEAIAVDLDVSTVTLPDSAPMRARVFVVENVAEAPSKREPAAEKRDGDPDSADLPRGGRRPLDQHPKLLALIGAAIDADEDIGDPKEYFVERGRKTQWAKKFHNGLTVEQRKRYELESVKRQLRVYLGGK